MAYQIYICDVFTDRRFGGNQLAVLPDASGLSDKQMLSIAREFNFSESTFVLAPEDAQNTRKVRIFTPGGEVPFAGHPNVGTAFVLAATNTVPCDSDNDLFRFEEKAGVVPVRVERRSENTIFCELTAPEPLSLGASVNSEAVAHALHLGPDAVVSTRHPPRCTSVGLPFLVTELADLKALAKAQSDLNRLRPLLSESGARGIHIYTRNCPDTDWDMQARMYSAGLGISEDAATGSANVALAALLAHLDDAKAKDYQWTIAQGVEMGRPSLLEARASKADGELTSVRIGGTSVMVAEGQIEV
ncbi:MAG: PhzF family phenazine biosynthesis protein [Pseudomonadota bacterium]